jgi:ABC-type transport system substrate-binding protein
MSSQVLVNKDWDIVFWGYGLLDDPDANYPLLYSQLNSKQSSAGFNDAEMDAALELLRLADTPAKSKAAYAKISEVWVRDVPSVVASTVASAFVSIPKLHGVQRTAVATVLYDKAWLSK